MQGVITSGLFGMKVSLETGSLGFRVPGICQMVVCGSVPAASAAVHFAGRCENQLGSQAFPQVCSSGVWSTQNYSAGLLVLDNIYTTVHSKDLDLYLCFKPS